MTATAHTIDARDAILTALDRWIRQRPGLEFGNYGDWSAYRAEVRSIGRDLAHARTLLAYVYRHPSIDADRLKAALRYAYSGRLAWNGLRLGYCTDQYWPTEYRKAACAVLASAIWNWWWDECMPAPDAYRAAYADDTGSEYVSREFETREAAEHYAATESASRFPRVVELRSGKRAGDWLRANARREFGNGIAARWFN